MIGEPMAFKRLCLALMLLFVLGGAPLRAFGCLEVTSSPEDAVSPSEGALPMAAEASPRPEEASTPLEEALPVAEEASPTPAQASSSPGEALPEPDRIALVIGNSDYSGREVKNADNDAANVGAALGRLGFEVTHLENAGYTTILHRLVEFGRAATRARMAIVFYSGTSYWDTGRNELAPVDTGAWFESGSRPESVPLVLAINAVEHARDLGLVIMDSSPVSHEQPPRGTLVALAAQPGEHAWDVNPRSGEDEENSPYTKALLGYLEEPGLEVGVMFRKVRDAVRRSTENKQVPITYGSLPVEGIYLIAPEPVAES